MTPPRARTPTQIARARAASEAIGRKIRALRTARGWTLEQASEAIDLDPRHLQRVETGAVSPSAATLLRVADSLEVPVGALFDLVPPSHAAVLERTQTPRAEDGVDVDALPARVGRRIAMLRNERGRTQAQLASAAGLTEQYVHRVESGRQNPSLKVLARLAHALDVSLPEVVRIGETPGNSGS